MNFKTNLIVAAVIAVAIYWMISKDNGGPSQTAETPQATPTTTSGPVGTNYFNPSSVTKIVWTDDSRTLTLAKSGDKWISSPPSTTDTWQVVRRLNVLSKFAPTHIEASAASGKVIITAGKDEFGGQFDTHAFVWTSGNNQGQGIDFKQHPDIGEIFQEGLTGFRLHEVEICNPAHVTRLSLEGSWNIVRDGSKWRTSLNDKTEPARTAAVTDFLSRVCRVNVESFKPTGFDDKLSRTFMIVNEDGAKIEIKKSGDVYNFRDLNFVSARLDEMASLTWDDIKDPALEEGRVALDNSKSTPERLAAIRKIKDTGSKEGIPALKAIVFENTDIDVYRYEAVDALASIGTKECFALIAKRLSEVDRSGFQLRLARSLAAAIGRPFISDEKTPDPERKEEVRELLEAYKKTPPGK